MQITPQEIAETLAMVNKQNLDIRTITLGLNLRGCVDSDINVVARKVYNRMTTAAEKLVPTAEQLEREFGIPIVNKRISVTPIAEVCAAVTAVDLTPVAEAIGSAPAKRWASILSVAFRHSCRRAPRWQTPSSWSLSLMRWRLPIMCVRR